MKRVHSRSTNAEKLVRKLTRRIGYKFRLNQKELPGCPDIVFPKRRKVIFIHGCFWHQHLCRRGSRTPKSNISYWRRKLTNNKKRDAKNARLLRKLGWKVLVIWECEITRERTLQSKIKKFLAPSKQS